MWYIGFRRSVRLHDTARPCNSLTRAGSEVRGENRTVNQAGYTKAVDMWSVGCVTTALLAGKSYFVNTQDSDYRRNSSAAIIKAAAECNLDRLDNSSAWLDVNPQTKGFVKELLVLDEKTRLTAQQALNHLWFTEGSRRAALEKTYKQIIEGWKPWSPGWDFITHLDCFIEARIPQKDVAYFLPEALAIANKEQARRLLLSPQEKEDSPKARCQLQQRLPEQLKAPGMQNASYGRNKRAEYLDLKGPSPSMEHQEAMKSTHLATNREQKSVLLSTNEQAIYAELEDHYRPRNPLLEERISSDHDNQVSSRYFLDVPRTSSASSQTAVQNIPEGRGEIGRKKRRRTTLYDYEDAAIHTEAGKENRGFVSAKTYSQTVTKKRGERVK